MGSCSVSECRSGSYARGLCSAHYRRWQKYGDPLAGGITRTARGDICSVDGCGEPVRARGWCTNHYGRWKRNGDPLGGKPSPRGGDGSCSVDDCPGTAHSRGWCPRHYYRWKTYDDPLATQDRRLKAEWVECAVANCTEWRTVRDWCTSHYQRWRKYGNPEEPLRRARNGEGYSYINHDGYVVLKRCGKTIMEHRKVMEEKLGRALLPGETVHHMNGIRTDNRPENLELWVSTRSGQRVADLIAFVVERYRRDVEAALGGAV